MPESLRVVHLEDEPNDAELVRRAVEQAGFHLRMEVVDNRDDFLQAIALGRPDLILSDSGVAGLAGRAALAVARQAWPGVPFIFVSGQDRDAPAAVYGADRISKSDLSLLPGLIGRSLGMAPALNPDVSLRLVSVVQQLSLARDLDAVMAIVRLAARDLTGADGATFVLREGDLCHYAEENAIAPLWKGRRFPLSACISGWVMLNRQPAVIEDIYADARIPADAYRPTFVRSLAMVPIRTAAPIGAIGNYWAGQHKASDAEVELLQALANSTSIALENIDLCAGLERRVRDRTAELTTANAELDAFAYSVSHDLRAPLRSIAGFGRILAEEVGDSLSPEAADALVRIQRSADRMNELIENLLRLSRIAQRAVKRAPVDLAAMAEAIVTRLREADPERRVEVIIERPLSIEADEGLVTILIENLISNAWKYTGRTSEARVQIGATGVPGNPVRAFFVRDNGAGFDMTYARKLFAPFQRMHADADFPGIGIGLAICQRIVHKHGGTIQAEAAPGQGATFTFTLAGQA